MIRLAVMSSVCPDWTVDETIAAMKRLGYAGYEPRVEWKHRSGVELALSGAARAALRQRFAAEGLSICCVATGVSFAMPEPEKRAEQAELLKQYIGLAGDLGAPRIRIFGGKLPGGELRGVITYMAAAIRPVMDLAQDRGVTVLLETHDDWCRSNQVRELVQTVNHPHFAVLWDIMHTQRFLETPRDSFALLGPHIRHLHIHDGRYAPDGMKIETSALGEGSIDHAGPLALLKQAGFDGFASLEVIHKVGNGGRAEEVMRQYAEGLKRLA